MPNFMRTITVTTLFASVTFLVLGAMNFEVRFIKENIFGTLGEFLGTLFGSRPDHRQYTCTIDEVQSIEMSSRTIAQYETFSKSGTVNPFVGVPVQSTWPFPRNETVTTSTLLYYELHIGFEADGFSAEFSTEDSTFTIGMPQPEILAIEFEPGSLRDIHTYGTQRNPSLTIQGYDQQLSSTFEYARELASAAVTEDDYNEAKANFEQAIDDLVRSVSPGIRVEFQYEGEEQTDNPISTT